MEPTREYSIVHFIAENSVEAVPTKWVRGETCFWPSKGCARKIINDNTDPSEGSDRSWSKLEARVLRTFDSKEKARSYLEQSTMHSNLDTDNEHDGKEERKKKAKKHWSSESSEDMELQNGALERKITSTKKTYKTLLPERPRVMLKHSSYTTKEKALVNDDELPGTSPSCCNSLTSHVSPLSLLGKENVKRLDSRTPPASHSQGTSKMLGEILKNQKIIMATLAEHGEILRDLQKARHDEEAFLGTSRPDGWPERMPLACLQEFNEWERLMKNEDNHSFAVDYFSKLGGENCSDMCRRVMRKLFTVGLSTKLNIQGSEKKCGLKSTATLNIIQSACRRYFSDIPYNAVEKETVSAIGKWLRNQCPKKPVMK